MSHLSRQPMSPTTANVTILTAENEALRRRVAQLEDDLAAERGPVGKPLPFKSTRQK